MDETDVNKVDFSLMGFGAKVKAFDDHEWH
jgi:hypothetical protein